MVHLMIYFLCLSLERPFSALLLWLRLKLTERMLLAYDNRNNYLSKIEASILYTNANLAALALPRWGKLLEFGQNVVFVQKTTVLIHHTEFSG